MRLKLALYWRLKVSVMQWMQSIGDAWHIATLPLKCAFVCFFFFFSVCSRALKSSQHSLCSLLIVDTPGFQNPRLTKHECGGTSFEDLCHNYTQERLQTLFYQRTFVQELERYKEVKIKTTPAKDSVLYVHTYIHTCSSLVFLSLPSSLSPFVCCFPSDISSPIVYVFTHQRSYPSHLSQAVTSQSSSCVRPSH